MKHDLSVMLIGQEKEAFDDEDWIFELKMDGIRVLAYIEDHQVDLRNKRNLKLTLSGDEGSGKICSQGLYS